MIDTSNPSKKDLRSFGITMGIVVALVFGLLIPWVWGFQYRTWPWIFMGVFVLWGLVLPMSLGPLFRVWMRLASLISRVTTPILLGIVFALVFIPIGLLFRLLSGDPMRRKFEPESASYRVYSDDKSVGKLENPY